MNVKLIRQLGAVCWLGLLATGQSGCTGESTRVALAAQRRADAAQRAVFDRQHEGLCILLYRDLVRRLENADATLTDEQRAALNEVWNERDLIEFWAVQHERAAALRLIGVDAKLFSAQSPVDLLVKSLAARAERVKQRLAACAGADLETSPENAKP
ncbi:MAG: hypothetical protein KKB50_04275 [Planctomycetes bacterium]|nr:hypothetical protein [Planctomycetota bacterium]